VNGRGAYYNEHDPYAAQWLRNLIAAGHIADGDVDERSIVDVRPCELRGYSQWHLLAGIGVWSYALRLAGWSDSRSVLTCSCPCQPFSAAGKGAGFADERHLWPAAFHIIRELEPATIFGEQVASKDAEPWIDLVHADLETVGYAFGCIPFPSASVGAPHIRDRAYWVAHTSGEGLAQRAGIRRLQREAIQSPARKATFGGRTVGRMGDAELPKEKRQREYGWEVVSEQEAERLGLPRSLGGISGLVDWVACGDSFYRPIEPGTFPLVDGAAFRVGSGSAYEGKSRAGMFKGYGNAINAEAAAAFIRAYLDVERGGVAA